MYNLSPRWKPIKTATSPYLGPSQYYIDDKEVPKNVVPFLSSEPLVPCRSNKPYTEAFYNVRINDNIIGGSSLRNTSLRFPVYSGKNPSPFEYDPKLPPIKSGKTLVDPAELKGRHLYVCRVPFYSDVKGPSIPTKADANGYRVVEGKLAKQSPRYSDVTLGPAFYNVKVESCTPSGLYKGRCWSRSKTARLNHKYPETPSPCTYDTSTKKTFNARDELVREMARASAFVPRFLDAVVTRVRIDNFPAPNQYNIQSKNNHCHQKSQSRNPPAFNSRAERFHRTKSESPGANAYNFSSEIIKSGSSMKSSPFNVDSDRFPSEKEFVTPGPSDYYNINGSLEEKLVRKMRARTNFAPPFNYSAKREMTFISKEAQLIPCPFEYTLEAPLVTTSVSASIFKSRTERFPKINTLELSAFDVAEQFNKNRNPRSHNKSKVAFQSKRISRGNIFKPSSFYAPSPSSYNAHKSIGFCQGGKIGKSTRFEFEVDRSPGPAAYDLPLCMDSSLYKATTSYNLRLNQNAKNSKIKGLLDKPQEKKIWREEIKKRKILRTFYTESDTDAINWIDLIKI